MTLEVIVAATPGLLWCAFELGRIWQIRNESKYLARRFQ